PLLGSYAPALGVAETNARPAGSRSVTWSPVAPLGPWLLAVMVKVTSLPTFGVGLSTVLVMPMSAASPVTVALAVLLPLTGSTWPSAVLVAVFVIADVPVAVAVIDRVALDPLARAPMVQTPVPES